MKKWWIFLAVILAFSMTQSSDIQSAQAQEQPPLRVASMTAMTGKFFTGMWGMNGADIDVRQLLHSYPTVDWLQDQTLAINPVAVRNMQVNLDAQGNRVHQITLHQDLYFSDGKRIRAQDYVFSVLLQYSPYIRELGGVPIQASFLRGGNAYQNKETDRLLGVRLLDDYVFSLTITGDSYPYYYDLVYINVRPYPLHIIAPGCEIEDSAQGAYLKGSFDAKLLKETILNPQTGYMSHPSVTSGAYQLTDYNPTTQVASFVANPYYKGNINGIKPVIKQIEFRSLSDSSEILPALKNGQVDLVNKVSDRQVRDEAKTVPDIASSLYDREGLGFIAFLTEQEPVHDVRLRRAVAHLVDKETLVKSFLGEYGRPVDAYYGIGQWMAQRSFLDTPKWTVYPCNSEMAAALIQEAGYAYDHAGKAYVAGSQQQRYGKSKDGKLKPLILRMAITQDHPVAELLVAQMEKDLAQVGIGLMVDRITLPELMQVYYAQSERKYDMLFLASNFYDLFDPYYIFHTDPKYRGMNATFIQDEALMLATKRMRETPSDQKEIYYKHWIAFQKVFTQVLPMIPLYSNTYSDLYTTRLTGYNIENYYSFADAIVEAKLE